MSTRRAQLLRRARRYLSVWKENIGIDNGQGLTDINSDAEDFCCGLLNILLNARLQNMNLEKMNFPAIDLADDGRRICVQVTATSDAEKITHTLDRFFRHGLEQKYDRLIVMILGDKKNYRTQFPRKEGFAFDPDRDIWDIKKLVTAITGLSMQSLEQVDDYLRQQFPNLEDPTPPMYLPVRSALDDNSFLGREKELEEITRQFEQQKLVILSGLGGMGKSELAARFALTRWGGESYFVRFTTDWKHTVLENIVPFIRGFRRDNADENRTYRDAMAELKSRGADELLILDNVDQAGTSLTRLKRELSELNLRILITTRIDAPRKIAVEPLPHGELYRLFTLHESAASPEEQRALIDAVGGHTLTVDLMARALRPGRRAATAEKLLKNLADDTVRKVETAYEGAPDQARIAEHLKAVFRVVELEPEEQELLRYAALLPEGGMDDSLFLAPIEQDRNDPLDHLIDNGWLNFKDNLLSIHPVIRMVCADVLKPNEENCGAYLDALWRQLGRDEYDRVKFAQLAEVFANAVEIDAAPEARAEWLNRSGRLWGDLMESRKCTALYEKHIPTLEQQIPAHPALATAYNNVGLTYGDLGDHSKALEYHLKALAIRENVLPPNHPDLALSYNNVGTTYSALGDHSKALEFKLKALAIQEKVLPRSHPDLAISYGNVGYTYGALGDHNKALEYHLKDLAICEKVLPPTHPSLATSYNNVGSTYGALGDHNKALEYHLKALAIFEKVLSPEHPHLGTTYNDTGITYGDLGDHSKALEYHLKSLTIYEKVLPPEHPFLATSCNNIAWTYRAMGQYQEAAVYMRRAADIISRSSLPENHPDRINLPNWADRLEKEAGL